MFYEVLETQYRIALAFRIIRVEAFGADGTEQCFSGHPSMSTTGSPVMRGTLYCELIS